LLIVGDLNTGRNDCDLEQGAAKFSCEGHFMNLETTSGLTDIWRSQHGASAQEWTWRSPKNGFRIDHAFANEAFRTAFKKIDCYYLHEPRESHVTDHSALVVDLFKSTAPA
jgi:exodeoxyribonuclease III